MVADDVYSVWAWISMTHSYAIFTSIAHLGALGAYVPVVKCINIPFVNGICKQTKLFCY